MKILKIHAKCNDACRTTFTDGLGEIAHQGYVIRELGIGGGDYIKLEIDVETGKIVNWNSPDVRNIIQEKLEE